MIKYAIYPSPYDEDSHTSHGKVVSTGHVSAKGIINEIIARGSTVTEADTAAVMLLYKDVLLYYLKSGHSVTIDGIGKCSLSLKGVFNGRDDKFDARRHTFEVNVRTSRKLRKAINNAPKTKKVISKNLNPNILSCFDGATKTLNISITPGSICTLKGMRLNFIEANADEGIYLVDSDTKAVTKVMQVAQNTPKKLIFMVPQLTATQVQIQIKTRLPNKIKNTRTGYSNMSFTVNT